MIIPDIMILAMIEVSEGLWGESWMQTCLFGEKKLQAGMIGRKRRKKNIRKSNQNPLKRNETPRAFMRKMFKMNTKRGKQETEAAALVLGY
jgi:hypothetical protein